VHHFPPAFHPCLRRYPWRAALALVLVQFLVLLGLSVFCWMPLNDDRTRAAYAECGVPPASVDVEGANHTSAAASASALPPRAAIVYLVAPYPADIAHLRSSLDLLECHLLSAYPYYPVIIYYERLSEAVRQDLTSRVPSATAVHFEPVRFSFPDRFDPSAEKPIWTKRTRWGYSHMIRTSLVLHSRSTHTLTHANSHTLVRFLVLHSV
jgi:hypothetical protein